MEGVRILLVLMLFSVKCRAMSHPELEDFKEFLEKTSALDHILKDGFLHIEDEDEVISDHAWEESGKFEGDLILSARQRKIIVDDVAEGLSRNGLNDITKRWPNNEVIYYIQKEHFSGDQVQAIQDGIEDIGQSSCISFRPYKKGDRDAVVIQGNRRGCFSQVGYQSGYQVLNLSGRHPVGRGCFRHGTVVHELLHTLGFYHMQSSADRDDYIDVAWDNIIERAKHNFRKYNSFAVTDFGVGYDYDSVLHYSKRAFSKNGKATLIPKQDSAQIGQRVGMSDKDKEKLNKMYCDKDNNNNDDNDSIEQQKIKKQTIKSKPFEGHGIGYHQGKAVVIKLPTADTYLLPDLPSYHIKDYFSKLPETLTTYPSSDEVSFKTPNFASDYETFIYKAPPKAKEKKVTEEVKPPKANKATETNVEKEKDSPEIKRKSSERNETKHDVELDAALDDAFDRLKKIIKTHVYPTRGVDVKPYREDGDLLSKSKSYYEELGKLKEKIEKVNNDTSDEHSYDRPSLFRSTSNNESHSLKEGEEESGQNSKEYPDFDEAMEKRLESIIKSFSGIEDLSKPSSGSDYADYSKQPAYNPHSYSDEGPYGNDKNGYRAVQPTNEKLKHGLHFSHQEPYPYSIYYKPKKWLYK